MVRIRMSRMGRVHRPFYRISAIDQRTKRDGRVIEPLGWYDPIAKDPAKQIKLDVERIKRWLSVGAQPSDTVRDLLAKHNIIDSGPVKAEHERRAKASVKGKPCAAGEKKEAAAS